MQKIYRNFVGRNVLYITTKFDVFMTVCFCITVVLFICTYVSDVKAKRYKMLYYGKFYL